MPNKVFHITLVKPDHENGPGIKAHALLVRSRMDSGFVELDEVKREEGVCSSGCHGNGSMQSLSTDKTNNGTNHSSKAVNTLTVDDDETCHGKSGDEAKDGRVETIHVKSKESEDVASSAGKNKGASLGDSDSTETKHKGNQVERFGEKHDESKVKSNYCHVEIIGSESESKVFESHEDTGENGDEVEYNYVMLDDGSLLQSSQENVALENRNVYVTKDEVLGAILKNNPEEVREKDVCEKKVDALRQSDNDKIFATSDDNKIKMRNAEDKELTSAHTTTCKSKDVCNNFRDNLESTKPCFSETKPDSPKSSKDKTETRKIPPVPPLICVHNLDLTDRLNLALIENQKDIYDGIKIDSIRDIFKVNDLIQNAKENNTSLTKGLIATEGDFSKTIDALPDTCDKMDEFIEEGESGEVNDAEKVAEDVNANSEFKETKAVSKPKITRTPKLKTLAQTDVEKRSIDVYVKESFKQKSEKTMKYKNKDESGDNKGRGKCDTNNTNRTIVSADYYKHWASNDERQETEQSNSLTGLGHRHLVGGFKEIQKEHTDKNAKINSNKNKDNEASEKLETLRKRVKERKMYLDHELDDDDIEGKRSYKIEDKIENDSHTRDYVRKLHGEEFNLRYLQENGLQYPIIFMEKTGLGLRVPSDNFKVSDVKACVGSRRMLDVMDVNTQKGLEMTMKEWVKYYENLDRDRLLNVISLEFSHTKLENYVESPNLVREVDWVDTAWPQHLKDCQTESTNAIDKMKYPKVQKYCLMSVAGCYTDFHIDFGGTSVWYHILHGEKIFWLIPPTDTNLIKYESWVLSGKQGDAFLADSIEDCQMIRLLAGNTFIIPSGWIHAVYTPKDSLVFGGNFLHSYNMVNQLKVAAIEDKTHVPTKFRYPFYAEINWYVLERYVHSLTGVTYLEKPQLDEDLQLVTSKTEKEPPSLEMLEEKLNKRLAVSLTRIDDASPRRKSSSDDDSTASGPTRSPGQSSAQPRLSRKSSSDSANSIDLKLEKEEKPKAPYRSPVKKNKKHVHLTKYELEGLIEVVAWIENLPPTKKGIPKDLIDPETVLKEIRSLIREHINDNPELAITGEPVLEWTKATKKLIKLKQKAKTAKLMGSLSGPKPKPGGKLAAGSRRRRVRCKQCEPCTREDCQECSFCKDMKKYGGPGRAKQSCISRQCLRPNLPNSVTCQICNLATCKLERPVKLDGATDDEEDFSTSLMECGICWEIVHPLCLSKKFEELNTEGIINEDLPNSWKCAKCCFDGKEGQLKSRVFKGGWRPNASTTPPPMSISPPPVYESSRDSMDNIVTEGKRVTVNNAIDSKPGSLSLPKLSSPIKQESLLSKMEITTNNNTSIKEDINCFNVTGERVKAEKTENVVVKSEPKETGNLKRKLSPESNSASKRKREISPKPKPAKSSKPLKLQHVKKEESPLNTKRSKRETIAGMYTYDFVDEELMDVSTPLPEKGKGKSPKGKKSVHLKHKVPGHHSVAKLSTKSLTYPTAEQKSGDLPTLPSKKSVEKVNSEQLKQTLIEHIEKRNLPKIMPRFAVRPVGVSPPEKYVSMTNGQRHPLNCELWTNVFRFLGKGDLARCLAVCKCFNRWAINSSLWKKIDLSRKRIVQVHLLGIVRRQPIHLDLSAVVMTQKQILWLLERLPLLKTLVMSKCSWATLSGLCMSSCPLLYTLDISWATGLNDKCFEDLIMPPVDRKPAVNNVSRLHRLRSLNISGSEITDMSMALVAIHLTELEHLNLSYCARVTDQGMKLLTDSDSTVIKTLKSLNVSGCRQLTNASLDAVSKITSLVEFETVNCIRITPEKSKSLIQARKFKKVKY